MRGAHRPVAGILQFAMIATEDVPGETRAPQRDQRRDQPRSRCQRRRQQRSTATPGARSPRPHPTSAMLASRRLRLSSQTRVTAVRTVARPARAVIMPVTIAWRSGRTRGARSLAAALGPLRDRAQHPSEHQGVDRKEHVPVDQAEQSGRLEHRGLVDDRRRSRPAPLRTRATHDPATSFPPRAAIVGSVRTPRPARSRGCRRRPVSPGRAARDASPRRPSGGRLHP